MKFVVKPLERNRKGGPTTMCYKCSEDPRFCDEL